MLDKEFTNIINNIKSEIKVTRLKTMQQANSNLMILYFKIGKILNENSKYGNEFIKNIAMELKLEYPNMKGFSERNLKRMKRFYKEYKDYTIVPQAVAQLPWGHNILLIEKIKNIDIRKIYIDAIIENGWSRNVLEIQIENNYHLKKEIDNDTISLLLCRNKEKITVEWSLKNINIPIGVSSFKIHQEILQKLPTEEELNLHISMD